MECSWFASSTSIALVTMFWTEVVKRIHSPPRASSPIKHAFRAHIRAAKDLSDLLMQEASAVAERGRSPPTRGGVGAANGVSGGGGGARCTSTKSRSKKKRSKKKRSSCGCSSAVGSGAGQHTEEDGGSTRAVLQQEQQSDIVGCSHGSNGVSHAHAKTVSDSKVPESKGKPADIGGGNSTDSSDVEEGRDSGGSGGFVWVEDVAQRSRRDRGGAGGEEGGRVARDVVGDESMDDEEEQRGVVKKLRWRTEIGIMG